MPFLLQKKKTKTSSKTNLADIVGTVIPSLGLKVELEQHNDSAGN